MKADSPLLIVLFRYRNTLFTAFQCSVGFSTRRLSTTTAVAISGLDTVAKYSRSCKFSVNNSFLASDFVVSEDKKLVSKGVAAGFASVSLLSSSSFARER